MTGQQLRAEVLLALAEQPTHGYELCQRIEGLNQRSTYRLLEQFRSEGLAKERWDTPEAGPARRVYELTPAGHRELLDVAAVLQEERNHLDAWLDRWVATSGDRTRRRWSFRVG